MKGESMEITNGKMKIECKTLKGNKRPALIIQHDHLHSKVGMMMDDERAEEFMNYLSEFLRAQHD